MQQPSSRRTPSLRLLTCGAVAVLALSGAGSAAFATPGGGRGGPSSVTDVATTGSGSAEKDDSDVKVKKPVVEAVEQASDEAPNEDVGEVEDLPEQASEAAGGAGEKGPKEPADVQDVKAVEAKPEKAKNAKDEVDEAAACVKASRLPGASPGQPEAGTVGNADCHEPKGQGPEDANNGHRCDGDATGVQNGNPAHSPCPPPVVSDPVVPVVPDPIVPIVPIVSNPVVPLVPDPVVPVVKTEPVVNDTVVSDPTVTTPVSPADTGGPAAPVVDAPVSTVGNPAQGGTNGPAVTPGNGANAGGGSSAPDTAAQQPTPTTGIVDAPGQGVTVTVPGNQPSAPGTQPVAPGAPGALPGDDADVTGQPAPGTGTVEQPGEQEPGTAEGVSGTDGEAPVETVVEDEDTNAEVTTTAVAASGSDEGAAEAAPTSLPFTGASTDQVLTAGTVLLVVGLLLALTGRRRRTA